MMLTMGSKTFWKKSAMELIMRLSSSYRVVPSFGERVTAEHPSSPHEAASQQAVLLHGMERVQRTARREPARRWEHGGEDPPVTFDQGYAQRSEHRYPGPTSPTLPASPSLRSAVANSSFNSRSSALAAAGRADTTRSQLPGISEMAE